jgi:hypothetical protein
MIPIIGVFIDRSKSVHEAALSPLHGNEKECLGQLLPLFKK